MFKRGDTSKLKFNVTLEIRQLADFPLINAIVYTKWKMVKGSSSGATAHAPVVDNVVHWGETFTFQCTMQTAGPLRLAPLVIKASVRQETKGGKGFQRIGHAFIDLAEYVGLPEDTVRRYLLESCMSNAALEVCIGTTQTSGGMFKPTPVGGEQAVPGGSERVVPGGATPAGDGVAGSASMLDDGMGGIGGMQDELTATTLITLRDEVRLSEAMKSTRRDAEHEVLAIFGAVAPDAGVTADDLTPRREKKNDTQSQYEHGES